MLGDGWRQRCRIKLQLNLAQHAVLCCHRSDAEFGRQYKAGCNPAVLAVPASLPVGCAISEDDVSGALTLHFT